MADFSDIFSDDERPAELALVDGAAAAAVAVAVAAPRQTGGVGRGRHGDVFERRALAYKMLAGRQQQLRCENVAKQAEILRSWIRVNTSDVAGTRKLASLQVKQVRSRKKVQFKVAKRKFLVKKCKVRQLLLVMREASGCRKVLSPYQYLDCAYDHSHHSDAAKAACYGMSPRSSIRCCLSTCMAYLFLQEKMLERMLMAFQSQDALRPLYLVKWFAWDETGQKLVTNRATTTFEIMITRIKIYWAWAGPLPMH